MNHYLIAQNGRRLAIKYFPTSRADALEYIRFFNLYDETDVTYRFTSELAIELNENEVIEIDIRTLGIRQYSCGRWGIVELTNLTKETIASDLEPSKNDIELWLKEALSSVSAPPSIRVDIFEGVTYKESQHICKSNAETNIVIFVDLPTIISSDFKIRPFDNRHDVQFTEAYVYDSSFILSAISACAIDTIT